MNHVNFLMLGLGNGAVFAALALALVVTYRSSGVLNFATSAIAMFGAYTYAYLRKGALMFIIPGLPRRYHFGTSTSFWPAFLLTVVLCGVLGMLMYLLVFRPLRNAVAVAKAVASLGIMVLLTALVAQSADKTQTVVAPIFPQHAYTFGDVRINGDRLWFAVTIIGIAVLIAAMYRFTMFGLATRGASETEVGALVTGLKPDRIALVNWAIGAALCGVAGVLISPLAPLVPGTYTLFIVPALAAAVLGRLSSLVPAVVGGVLIGMLQSEAGFIHSTFSWTLSSGNAELIPLILVLVALLVVAKPLPSRGTLFQSPLGKSPRPRHIALPTAVFFPVGVLALALTHGTMRGALIMSLTMAIVSLSLVVVTGYAGQISLAQLTLAGAGGFLLSRLTEGAGIPFPIAPVIAALGATVIGVVLGLPALRLRGLLVGIVTLTMAVALEAGWFRNIDINGGGQSGAPIKAARFLGIDLSVGTGLRFPRIHFAVMVLVVLTIVCIGVAFLRGSRLGAAMLAVRANERSAAAVGISVTQVKIIAFALGAFIAGIGGSLLAYQLGSVTFDSYSVFAGLGLLTVTYLAGITSIEGAIVAGILAPSGIFYTLIDRHVHIGQWYGVVSGLGVIITVMRNPEGIVGPTHAFLEKRRLRRLEAATAPEGKAPAGTTPTTSPAAPPPGEVILAVEHLTVKYGGVAAVNDVSFAVREGQIVGLIGPNGAGKTTTMDALSGFARYTGTVTVAGKVVDGLKTHRRVALGLGRTFQGIDLYDDLTVAENISIGQHVAADQHDMDGDLDRIIERLGLTAVRERSVSELSQGQRQLVSIARSLSCQPKVLLLDEPAAGLDSTESMWLAEQLREIRASGVTILLVDHDMGLVLSLCDEIHVLDFGERIASGTPEEIVGDQRVAEAYLGSSFVPEEPTASTDRPTGLDEVTA